MLTCCVLSASYMLIITFRNRLSRFCLCSRFFLGLVLDTPTFDELCDTADDELFSRAVQLSNYVLHALLPPSSTASLRYNGAKSTRRTCAAPHSFAPPGVPCVTKQLLSLRTRVSQLSSIDEQSGSSAHNHSTTLVPGRAAAAPGSATPELDSTHMNGLIDDKKRSVVPTVQSKSVCV